MNSGESTMPEGIACSTLLLDETTTSESVFMEKTRKLTRGAVITCLMDLCPEEAYEVEAYLVMCKTSSNTYMQRYGFILNSMVASAYKKKRLDASLSNCERDAVSPSSSVSPSVKSSPNEFASLTFREATIEGVRASISDLLVLLRTPKVPVFPSMDDHEGVVEYLNGVISRNVEAPTWNGVIANARIFVGPIYSKVLMIIEGHLGGATARSVADVSSQLRQSNGGMQSLNAFVAHPQNVKAMAELLKEMRYARQHELADIPQWFAVTGYCESEVSLPKCPISRPAPVIHIFATATGVFGPSAVGR